VPSDKGQAHRPAKERGGLARAFVAKALLNLPTTAALLERLKSDATLRRLCGRERRSEIPSESTFSRTFAYFAATEFVSRVHEALVKRRPGSRVVGHISRDATAIEGRESRLSGSLPRAKSASGVVRRRGRWRRRLNRGGWSVKWA
jgi:hypothetical protein